MDEYYILMKFGDKYFVKAKLYKDIIYIALDHYKESKFLGYPSREEAEKRANEISASEIYLVAHYSEFEDILLMEGIIS